jgi:RHS repeat-associated protein
MPNRHGQSDDYDYGFNGKLKDNEIKGNGNSYDFGARILDPRIGRWLSGDPLENMYPYASTYSFVGNSPIVFVDPDGKILKVYGTVAEFNKLNAVFTKHTAGYVKLVRDAQGKVTMQATPKFKKLSKKHQVLVLLILALDESSSKMAKIMNDPKETNIRLAENSEGEQMGVFRSHNSNNPLQTIDMDDVNVIGESDNVSAISAIMHEFTEAYDDQVTKGFPNPNGDAVAYNKIFEASHEVGLKIQAKINNADKQVNFGVKPGSLPGVNKNEFWILSMNKDDKGNEVWNMSTFDVDNKGNYSNLKEYKNVKPTFTKEGKITNNPKN